MPLFDRVMQCELMAEELGEAEERADRLAVWALVFGTGAIKLVPNPTEIIMLGRTSQHHYFRLCEES